MVLLLGIIVSVSLRIFYLVTVHLYHTAPRVAVNLLTPLSYWAFLLDFVPLISRWELACYVCDKGFDWVEKEVVLLAR